MDKDTATALYVAHLKRLTLRLTMKTLRLSVIAITLSLTTSFAHADQKIEKVWGQCQLTKMTVLKSKELSKGTQALNEVVTLSVERTISVVDEGTSHASYYDYTNLKIAGETERCLPHSCVNAGISQKDGYGQNDPQISTHKLKANSDKKLDLLLSEPHYTDWLKVTYDYAKASGKLEFRAKAREWFSTYLNDHIIYEIRNCNFQGPISLDPSQN